MRNQGCCAVAVAVAVLFSCSGVPGIADGGSGGGTGGSGGSGGGVGGGVGGGGVGGGGVGGGGVGGGGVGGGSGGGVGGVGGSGAGGGVGGGGSGYRILFDGAHKQVAGNADWVVDSHSPQPLPLAPTSATSWSGGISSWGYDLYASGRYQIHQLPTGTALSWGGGGPGDLQGFDVFISDEPEADFSSAEAAALVSFAGAGRGIFLISDHLGAARCGACVEAWQVINNFLEIGAANAFGVRCDGNDVGASGLTGSPTNATLVPHFTSGPFGAATTLIYHSGSTVSLVPGNASGEIVVSSSAGGFLAASQLPSGGRLVLLGDSSPADDGSCACSAALQNGWAEGADREFILNATAWLAHDG